MKRSNREGEATKIMQQCPRFAKCSVPICPLDPLQDERTYLVGEPRCRLSRNRRYAIGLQAGLPRLGLTKREYAAKLRWDGLSDSERERKKALLLKVSPFV